MDERTKSVFLDILKESNHLDLKKEENAITSPQGAHIQVEGARMLNLCSNNYLGLSNHPDLISAAIEGLKQRGYGMSSVRFICGTLDLHHRLEKGISTFLKTDATLLYSSCFDANTGLFEALFTGEDAILSDALNHASIIDGIRLCKASRYCYRHLDMSHLEHLLKGAQKHRLRLIVTDGVFSMDGEIAPLSQICTLAEKYSALVMLDDSHATGLMGSDGRGTIEHCNVLGRVDLVTSTLGKAMGGASGGFTSGRQALIELLRQHSRPYLFSNSLPPVIVSAALKALELISQGEDLRARLWSNTALFRKALRKAGFQIKPGIHPIIPIVIGDSKRTMQMAKRLFEEGIYTVPFSYPVVPRGGERIRVQISAAHSHQDLLSALDRFEAVGREVGVIS